MLSLLATTKRLFNRNVKIRLCSSFGYCLNFYLVFINNKTKNLKSKIATCFLNNLNVGVGAEIHNSYLVSYIEIINSHKRTIDH